MPLAICDGVFEILAGNDRHHRPEDFFLRDAHLGIDVGEYGRLHEVAVLVFAFIQTIAAALHAGAFGLSDLHILQVGLELVLVDCRAHVDGFVESVADFQFLRALHVALHELAVNALSAQ